MGDLNHSDDSIPEDHSAKQEFMINFEHVLNTDWNRTVQIDGIEKSAYFFGNMFRAIISSLESDNIDESTIGEIKNRLYGFLNSGDDYIGNHNTPERYKLEEVVTKLELLNKNQRDAAILLLKNHNKYYELPIEKAYDKQMGVKDEVHSIISNSEE